VLATTLEKHYFTFVFRSSMYFCVVNKPKYCVLEQEMLVILAWEVMHVQCFLNSDFHHDRKQDRQNSTRPWDAR